MIQTCYPSGKPCPQSAPKSRWLKDIIRSAALSDGAAWLLRPLFHRSWQGTFNVVYYHYAGSAQPHNSAFYRGSTTAKLAADLAFLGSIFEFRSLEEVLADGPGRRPLRRPILAITFDDGLELGREGAREVLERFGVKATTFVVTSTVGNRTMMWRHKLSAIQALVPEAVWRQEYLELSTAYGIPALREKQTLLEATYYQWDMRRKDEWAAELWERCHLPPIADYLAEKRPYFEWDGLRDWIAAGHSVGFHTHTHPFCSRLGPAEMESELVRPAVELKQRLGIDHLCLSYPFGDRLLPASEHELFGSGLFWAFFGTGGFTPKGSSNEKLERLAVEGCCVEKQLRSERLSAFRRRLLSGGHETKSPH